MNNNPNKIIIKMRNKSWKIIMILQIMVILMKIKIIKMRKINKVDLILELKFKININVIIKIFFYQNFKR